jgi:hypothetical protein
VRECVRVVEKRVQSLEQTVEFVLSSPMEEKTWSVVRGWDRISVAAAAEDGETNQAERLYEAQKGKRKKRETEKKGGREIVTNCPQ